MKKTNIMFSILAVLMIALSSCNDDKNEARYISYATIVDGAHKILVTDLDATSLYVDQNPNVVDQWIDGKRLIVDYTIISQKVNSSVSKAYYIRLNHVYDVLTKYPVSKSFLNTPGREDSIGSDPINLHDLWFANNYMNMDFGIYRNDPGITHFINLVVDDSKTTDDDVYVELRHNAYSDLQTVYSKGNVSFNVSDFIVPPKTSVKIHLSRKTYSGAMKTDTVTYQPGSTGVVPLVLSAKSLIK